MQKCTRHNTENNGGSTDYYKLQPEWKDCQDIIESKGMTFAQGNIFKAAFCFNQKRHDGTTTIRELNKIQWFVERLIKEEIQRIKEGGDGMNIDLTPSATRTLYKEAAKKLDNPHYDCDKGIE